jgi:hypothetical protein
MIGLGQLIRAPFLRPQIYSVITGHSQLMGVFLLNLTIPSQRPHFNCEEMSSRDHVPVRSKKLLPGCLLATLRSRFNALLLKDIGNGAARYRISQIAQRLSSLSCASLRSALKVKAERTNM